jgi:hypothetical protein
MQKLYTVRSEHAIPELNLEASYTWQVYNRAVPVVAYEFAIHGYCEQEYQKLSSRYSNATVSVPEELVIIKAARQMVDRLFTEAEARELQALLPLIHPGMTFTIDEVQLPILKPDYGYCAPTELDEPGSHVCPEDFAATTGQRLGFQVAACVKFLTRYAPEDFLNNLSPARLLALRKMHAAQNG